MPSDTSREPAPVEPSITTTVRCFRTPNKGSNGYGIWAMTTETRGVFYHGNGIERLPPYWEVASLEKQEHPNAVAITPDEALAELAYWPEAQADLRNVFARHPATVEQAVQQMTNHIAPDGATPSIALVTRYDSSDALRNANPQGAPLSSHAPALPSEPRLKLPNKGGLWFEETFPGNWEGRYCFHDGYDWRYLSGGGTTDLACQRGNWHPAQAPGGLREELADWRKIITLNADTLIGEFVSKPEHARQFIAAQQEELAEVTRQLAAAVAELAEAYGRGVSAGKTEALAYTPEERERYGRWVAESLADEAAARIAAVTAERDSARQENANAKRLDLLHSEIIGNIERLLGIEPFSQTKSICGEIEKLQQRQYKITAEDFYRLRAWSKDRSRKPSDVAFTAGVLRDAASAVEQSLTSAGDHERTAREVEIEQAQKAIREVDRKPADWEVIDLLALIVAIRTALAEERKQRERAEKELAAFKVHYRRCDYECTWRGMQINELREQIAALRTQGDGNKIATPMQVESIRLVLQELPKVEGEFAAYFSANSAEHVDDCPEDDTCECPLVCGVNHAFGSLRLCIQALTYSMMEPATHTPAAREGEQPVGNVLDQLKANHEIG